MKTTTKPVLRATPEAHAQPTTPARPRCSSSRRLDFESLEQRLYLAADVGSDATDSTNHLIDMAAEPAPVNFSATGPYLRPIETIELSHAVGKLQIPLHAENAKDAVVVFGAEKVAGNTADFDFQVGTIDSSIASNWGFLIITPRHEFLGTIQMLVGMRRAGDPDTSPWLDTQVVTVNVIDDGPMIDLSLSATASDGSPITNLRAGEDFVLHVWAQDLRSTPKGVFATYLNINWNSELAITTGDIKHADRFFSGKSGDRSHSGSVREAGGFGGIAQSNGGRFEVFSVPMRATGAGDLSLVASPAKNSPAHDMLVYGLDGGISPVAVQYGKLELTIAERPPINDPASSDPGITSPSDPIATYDPPAPALNPPPPLELPTNASADTIAGFSITVTAPDGTPLQNPRVSDDFTVHVWVKDARQIPLGVMAAFLNVTWNADLAAPTGPLSYGDRFTNPHPVSTIRPGMVEQAGGMEALGHSQREWLEVFSVPLRATADGELTLFTTPSTQSPAQDILVKGLDGGLDSRAVYFGIFSLIIGAGEPSTGTEQPPTKNDPSITNAPTIVAIPDDLNGNRFAVNILELLSPAMQSEFAANSTASNLSSKDNDSRAQLLGSANPDNVADLPPLPTIDHEADLAVVSRKPNPDSTADTLDDHPITAMTDLSLI